MYTIYRETDTRVRVDSGRGIWKRVSRLTSFGATRCAYILLWVCEYGGGGRWWRDGGGHLLLLSAKFTDIYIHLRVHIYICVLHGLHKLSMVERKYWSSSSIKAPERQYKLLLRWKQCNVLVWIYNVSVCVSVNPRKRQNPYRCDGFVRLMYDVRWRQLNREDQVHRYYTISFSVRI